MDHPFPTELPAFLDFCKSLDAGIVHTPEQAVELYRSTRHDGSVISSPGNLGADLRRLRQQIVASGAPLWDETQLDRERAERRGEKMSCE